MKMIIIMMMTMMSIMLTMTKHPMSMGLILMIQTSLCAMMVGFMIKSFWFSYMLFIIMMGGMLVLFIYMASIASNEKMKFSMKMTITTAMMMAIIITTWMMSDNLIMETNQVPTQTNTMENEQNLSLMKMFSMQTMSLTIMMVLYLLLTMIVITFIVNVFEGPMRKKN
uniref:NADH-ubiquinone oxidoreductase chain 6 n=1 Tax=Laccotrephes robustus TaxID=575834 RepID=C5HIT6_9HEMI|nr:NADH dehydrogenase subunit 6 [Laccotrephes robustus]ACJ69531.1 NADH dehydrogenase subunit 6 [Laccotrephes robustus]